METPGPLVPIDEIRRRTRAPLPACRYQFPDPLTALPEGLVAAGGDLEPSTIVTAYATGLFPWPHGGEDCLWWSPDPRAILPFAGLHISRRLARVIRQARFRVTIDTAFEQVIDACADGRDEGTWITPAMRAAYVELYRLGWAHSVEAWTADGTLAGGLYGLAVGGLFGAESMFHRETDASKVALCAFVQHAERTGFTVLDVQMATPHLVSMGAREIPRAEYLLRVHRAVTLERDFATG